MVINSFLSQMRSRSKKRKLLHFHQPQTNVMAPHLEPDEVTDYDKIIYRSDEVDTTADNNTVTTPNVPVPRLSSVNMIHLHI